MEEQVARFTPPRMGGMPEAFVSEHTIPASPPPAGQRSLVARARRNLFATPLDAVLTVLCGSILLYVVWSVFNWGILNATFSGADRSACLPEDGGHGGACWAFVRAKIGQFIYGVYPISLRWRPNLTALLFVALLVPLAIPSVPYKRLNAILLCAIFPLVALILLTGGDFGISGGFLAFLMLVAAAVTFVLYADLAGGFGAGLVKAALAAMAIGLLALVVASFTNDSFEILGLSFTLFSALAALAAIVAVACLAFGATGGGSLLPIVLPIIVAMVLAGVLAFDFGLRSVPTNTLFS